MLNASYSKQGSSTRTCAKGRFANFSFKVIGRRRFALHYGEALILHTGMVASLTHIKNGS
jgi:hypothetical protein